MLIKIAVLNFLVFVFEAAALHENPTVHVDQGILQGKFLTSRNGRKFAAFQGIPYAQPPVGHHRFKDPIPAKPWKGIWNASLPGSMCLQYQRIMPFADDVDPIIGDEDCLFINVYTPKISSESSNTNLDVIFFIHGGAFVYGWSHQYGPKFLLDRDVILVTFNYRLGPLGFLSTEDSVVPGNMGLKDQVIALQWVHKNIAAFGGNPDSITLIGNSAGGASVQYHYISPLSIGLFKRGYSQSGSILCPWTQMENGQAKAKMLGEALGCITKDTKLLIDCLRKRPARQIVQQVENFMVWRYTPFAPFGPTVEVAGSNKFISKNPIDYLLEGNIQNLPWMTSVTTEEGLYPVSDWITNEKITKELEQRYEEIFPQILDYNFTVPENKKSEVTNKILQHYLQGKPISTKASKEMIQMATDRLFTLEIARAAKLQAAVNSAPVFFYQFAYRGKNSLSDIMSATTTNLGVCHADDLGYTMECGVLTNPYNSKDDSDMTDLLLDIWYSYAHTGTPKPPGREIIWKPLSPNSNELDYLSIINSKQTKMQSSSNNGNQEFWDSLPIQEPQIGKNVPLKGKRSEL